MLQKGLSPLKQVNFPYMEGGYGGGGPHTGGNPGIGEVFNQIVYSLPPIEYSTYPNKVNVILSGLYHTSL